jgi:hypothetical protein
VRGVVKQSLSKHAEKMTKFNLHIFNVSITTVQFKECQPKGVRGVDYTMQVPYLITPARHSPFYTKLDAVCATRPK